MRPQISRVWKITFAEVTRFGVKFVVSLESQWATAGILIKYPGENNNIINIGKTKYQTKLRME